MAALHFTLPGPIWLFWPWKATGFLLLLYGVWLNGRSANLFNRHATTIKPFQESNALVTDGPYRLSRNPMYLGMVIILVAIAVLLGTTTPWVVVAVFGVVITLRFIVPEERALEEKFGDTYREYASRVRRWI